VNLLDRLFEVSFRLDKVGSIEVSLSDIRKCYSYTVPSLERLKNLHALLVVLDSKVPLAFVCVHVHESEISVGLGKPMPIPERLFNLHALLVVLDSKVPLAFVCVHESEIVVG